jgi:hypothetical protein
MESDFIVCVLRLNQERRNNGVGDCDFVNIAPLQFGEEIAWIHPIKPSGLAAFI